MTGEYTLHTCHCSFYKLTLKPNLQLSPDMVLLGDHCDVVLWIHCLESELKCCYFAQLWTNLWCFCTVLMIMVMYQCFLSGAGVFAIMFAVTVTSSCSRMIFCGKKSFVQLIFPKCHRGKCYLRVCVCVLSVEMYHSCTHSLLHVNKRSV